jgi:lysozyme
MAKQFIHDAWTSKYPVHGCDVSLWQDGEYGKGREPYINWDLAAPEQHFVILKVSEQRIDPEFIYNAQKTREKGLLRGGYHFFRWDLDIEAQVNLFVDQSRELELDLFLDVERNPFNPNVEPDAGTYTRLVERFTRLFYDARRKLLGKEPRPLGYYTRKSYWDLMLAPNQFSVNAPWFVAHWGVQKPALPRECTRWLFWQYRVSSKHEEQGLYNALDLDLFNGTQEEFNALYGLGATSPPPPPPPPPPPADGEVFDPPLAFKTLVSLNLRSLPASDPGSDILGFVYKNKTLLVDERVKRGSDTWLRAGRLWLAEKVRGKIYMAQV